MVNFDYTLNPKETLGGESRIRTYVDIRRQIYSLLPLTTRPSLQPDSGNRGFGAFCQWRMEENLGALYP